MIHPLRSFFGLGLLACLVLTALPAPAQSTGADLAWPRKFSANGAAFTIYQPQVDSWQGQVLAARVAVAVQPAGTGQPTFGTVSFNAMTAVDKPSNAVALSQFSLRKATFPTLADQAAALGQAVLDQAPQWASTIALSQIQASLTIAAAEKPATQAPVLQNAPPRIFFSSTPGVLVLVDGSPALRAVAGTSLLRVINTPVLLLFDPKGGTYYLSIDHGWAHALSLQGPWAPTPNPPPALAQALGNAGNFDPLTTTTEQPAESAPAGTSSLPVIFVSTVPAELVQTDGPPEFAPVEGTNLLYVKNSISSIILDVDDQNYYVLISGRWFRSLSLEGPWAFVPGTKLPADFARIPENGPAGAALASVPGTAQAKEARIANSIPQTAAINRDKATANVTYAGPPQFSKVSGTSLQYAVNTPTPVVKVNASTYYAVENGVWFTAPSPAGPWQVAATVPPVIYTIPPSCPIYYATGVYVYGATPEVVYVGYTPAYLGTCVAPDGVVVFGTGYAYPPYIGPTAWYGPPATYGFGAGFTAGLVTGAALGFAADSAWHCGPWWGPYHGNWGGNNNVNINRTVNNNVSVNRNYYQNSANNFSNVNRTTNLNNVNLNHTNVYNRWQSGTINQDDQNWREKATPTPSTHDQPIASGDRDFGQGAGTHPDPLTPDAPTTRSQLSHDTQKLGDNHVFAGHDDSGRTYKPSADGNSWQQYKPDGSWGDPDGAKPASSPSDSTFSRNSGGAQAQRAGGDDFRSYRRPSSGGFRSGFGGFHGRR
jgi:hypothetical protein